MSSTHRQIDVPVCSPTSYFGVERLSDIISDQANPDKRLTNLAATPQPSKKRGGSIGTTWRS
eukprot:2157923-Prorocentrum_lima.AAC.1